MSYYKKKDYLFFGFEKSSRKHKKYAAILVGDRGKITRIHFGDPSFKHYRDTTGLNIYKHLNHNDKKKRDSYHKRHKGFIRTGYYSAGYFSLNYLWK